MIIAIRGTDMPSYANSRVSTGTNQSVTRGPHKFPVIDPRGRLLISHTSHPPPFNYNMTGAEAEVEKNLVHAIPAIQRQESMQSTLI